MSDLAQDLATAAAAAMRRDPTPQGACAVVTATLRTLAELGDDWRSEELDALADDVAAVEQGADHA